MGSSSKITEQEKKFVLENFDKMTTLELAKKIGRSKSSIDKIKRELGVNNKIVEWTEDELKTLKELYPITDTKELSKKYLMRWSDNQIRAKARCLGIKKNDYLVNWSNEEIEILKSSETLTIREISDKLNKDYGATERKMKSLDLEYIKIKNNEGELTKCFKCGELLIKNKENFASGNICKSCSNKYNNVRKYRDKYGIILDEQKCFHTYTEEQWVDFVVNKKIPQLPQEIVNDKELIFKSFRYFVRKYLKRVTREDILNIDTHNSVYNGITFFRNYGTRNYSNFNDFIIDLYQELDLKHYEFKMMKKGYFENKDNRREYVRYFIEDVLQCDINNCEEYSKFFAEKTLNSMGYSRIVHMRKDYYDTYYHMLKDLFNDEFEISEHHFKTHLSDDGSLLDSNEELMVYEFIRDNYFKDIIPNGRKRKEENKYRNGDECYIPDFIINLSDDKKLIIEYFGLYCNNPRSDILKRYKEKTEKKIKFFKSLDNVYFIDLYCDDLKNGLQGVRDKLTSFCCMQN